MIDSKALSVVIPVYNGEDYIAEAIASCFSLGSVVAEVIVVDDGSEDGTASVVKGLAIEEPRLLLLEADRAGCGGARNVGIEAARGKYLTFLDADDVFLADNFLVFLERFAETDVEFGQASFFMEESGKKRAASFITRDLPIKEGVTTIGECPTAYYNSFGWAKIFRKEFLDKYSLRFPEKCNYEDQVFAAKLFSLVKKFFISDLEILSWRRDRAETSITRRKKTKKILEERFTGVSDSYKVVRESSSSQLLDAWWRKFWCLDIWVYIDDGLLLDEEYRTSLVDFLRFYAEIRPPSVFQGILSEASIRRLDALINQ